MKNYAHKMQDESSDCGLAAIQTILQQLKIDAGSLSETLKNVFLEKPHKDYDVQGLTLLDMEEILKKHGIIADSYEVSDFNELRNQRFPFIIMLSNDGMPHYCVVHNIDGEEIVLSNPAKPKIEVFDIESVKEVFLGYAICINQVVKKPKLERKNSYPEEILKLTLKEVPISKKFGASFLTIFSLALPIIFTYVLEYILGTYIDRLSTAAIGVLFVLILSLMITYFWSIKYNNYFKISINNKITDKVISLYFRNKLNDTYAKRNINNISAYFWNIIIAIQGLLEKFYLKIYLVFTGVLMIILSKYSILLSLILLFWTLVFYFFTKPLTVKLRMHYTTYIKESNVFASTFEEAIKTTLDINAFTKKNQATQNFRGRMESFFGRVIELGNTEAEIKAIRDIFTVFMLFTYFVAYYNLYISGNLTLLAGISSGVYVLYIATSGLGIVFDSYLEYIKSSNAIEYIESRNDFQGEKERKVKKLDVTKISSIKIKDLSFQYDDINILNHRKFSFDEGKLYGIVGANGTGKSTFIRLLCGLIKSQEGTYVINKKIELTDLQETDINRHISLYTPEMELYGQTAINNAFFHIFSDADQEDIEWGISRELKEEFGLSIPGHYIVTSGGTNISQGQRQKLLILRTLTRKADIYIFDEPTGNLDKESESRFLHIIKEMTHDENKIVIIVSHSEKIIQECDVVYDLNRGENI